MKLLLDMNLSPRWLALFEGVRIEAAHWVGVGPPDALDTEIMAYAAQHGYTVLNQDLDFSAILSATQGEKPSVVQIRSDQTFPSNVILGWPMRKSLFTIGHSTHTLEHFINLLTTHGIQAVSDVRSVPYSRHNPQFNRESLMRQLQAAGISYVFLGKELGARSDNPACYIDGKVQYNYLAEEPSFQEGLRRLRKGIESFRVALMCAERDPLTCHRTILVCRELRSADLEIQHILADGAIETNVAAERRLMSMIRLQPDMFHSERDCIERAYEKQANNIAYTVNDRNLDPQYRDLPDENLHDRLHQ